MLSSHHGRRSRSPSPLCREAGAEKDRNDDGQRELEGGHGSPLPEQHLHCEGTGVDANTGMVLDGIETLLPLTAEGADVISRPHASRLLLFHS